MSHDLSHPHSQLLELQINPLSHLPLPINYLHLHLHLIIIPTLLIITNNSIYSTFTFTSFRSFYMTCFVSS